MKKITKQRGDPGYWAEFLENFPKKNTKTRAAANVAVEMETRGCIGVTRELRIVLEKVVALARAQ